MRHFTVVVLYLPGGGGGGGRGPKLRIMLFLGRLHWGPAIRETTIYRHIHLHLPPHLHPHILTSATKK